MEGAHSKLTHEGPQAPCRMERRNSDCAQPIRGYRLLSAAISFVTIWLGTRVAPFWQAFLQCALFDERLGCLIEVDEERLLARASSPRLSLHRRGPTAISQTELCIRDLTHRKRHFEMRVRGNQVSRRLSVPQCRKNTAILIRWVTIKWASFQFAARTGKAFLSLKRSRNYAERYGKFFDYGPRKTRLNMSSGATRRSI